jgi:DNA-directed RNA polymerase subunit delta
MQSNTKKRIIKDYKQLPDEVREQLREKYPTGFSTHLIKFTNAKGEMVSALPFETDDIYYLVRMTVEQAIQIVDDEDDFDDLSNLDVNIKLDDEEEEIAKANREEENSDDDEEETEPYEDANFDEYDEDEEDEDDF